MIGTKETNFLLNLPLSDRQMSRLCKVFASNSLVNIKLSKTQLSKIIQARGFLGRLLEPYMKVGLPLIKNVLPRTPLTKSVLILLVLTAEQQIQEFIKFHGISGSSEDTKDIMKIVNSLEDSGILMKELPKQLKKKQNNGVDFWVHY